VLTRTSTAAAHPCFQRQQRAQASLSEPAAKFALPRRSPATDECCLRSKTFRAKRPSVVDSGGGDTMCAAKHNNDNMPGRHAGKGVVAQGYDCEGSMNARQPRAAAPKRQVLRRRAVVPA
jgi:hypothetical protein